MLRTRILTAVLLVPLVFWLLLKAPNAYLMPVILLCVVISAWEMAKIFSNRIPHLIQLDTNEKSGDQVLVPVLGSWPLKARRFEMLQPLLASVMAAAAFLCLNLLSAPESLPLFALLFVLYGTWQLLSADNVEIAVFRYLSTGFMLIYCVLPWTALWRLQGLGGSGLYVLFTLVVVFCGDTGGYFGGRFLGKHKLAPLLSPKKTVEGALTGLLLSMLGATLMNEVFDHYFGHTIFVVLIAAIGGAIAQLGDLFESGLKRFCGAKDSGSIIPGHGGLLDRVDGVLFAAPWFWLCFFSMT